MSMRNPPHWFCLVSWSAVLDVLRRSAQPAEYGIYALYIAVEKKWNRLGPIVGRHCECFFKWGQAVSCSQRCNGSVSHCLWNCCLMLMFSVIVVWFLRDWKMLQSMVFPMCWWKLFMPSENRDNGWKLAGLKSAWLKMQILEYGNLQQSVLLSGHVFRLYMRPQKVSPVSKPLRKGEVSQNMKTMNSSKSFAILNRWECYDWYVRCYILV